MSEPSTPFVLTSLFDDGSSEVNSYKTMQRATWNFTEVILKKYTVEAIITTDGGLTTLARWRRDASRLKWRLRPHEAISQEAV